MYTITISTAPLASGAIGSWAVTTSPMVSTRKKVPISSVVSLRVIGALTDGWGGWRDHAGICKGLRRNLRTGPSTCHHHLAGEAADGCVSAFEQVRECV